MIFVDRIAAGVVLVITIVVVGGGGVDGDFNRWYGRTVGRVLVVVVVVGRCDAEDVAHDDGCDEGQL